MKLATYFMVETWDQEQQDHPPGQWWWVLDAFWCVLCQSARSAGFCSMSKSVFSECSFSESHYPRNVMKPDKCRQTNLLVMVLRCFYCLFFGWVNIFCRLWMWFIYKDVRSNALNVNWNLLICLTKSCVLLSIPTFNWSRKQCSIHTKLLCLTVFVVLTVCFIFF